MARQIKNILLVGGSNPLGNSLLKNKDFNIHNPTKNELDLSLPASIYDFDLSEYDALFLLARAGRGQRYQISDWPADQLEYNLSVNVIGSMLLLQKWLQNHKNGTVVYVGSRSVITKPTYSIPYWNSKLFMIEAINCLRPEYPATRFVTINPPAFQNKDNETLESRSRDPEDEPTPDQVANWIWFAIENNLHNIDAMGVKK